MSIYGAAGSVVKTLNPGDTIILSNASLGASLKTAPFYIVMTSSATDIYVTVNNLSSVILTVQFAHADADANYQPYYNVATAVTIAANKASNFQAGSGFYRILAASDPGTAVIAVTF